MYKTFVSKLRRPAAAFAIALATLTAGTALAAPWRSATWGRGWATMTFTGAPVPYNNWRIDGQTDDILEDGHCVYARLRRAGQSWPGTEIAGSKSCGPVKSFRITTTSPAGVRLYREDGRYLTLTGS